MENNRSTTIAVSPEEIQRLGLKPISSPTVRSDDRSVSVSPEEIQRLGLRPVDAQQEDKPMSVSAQIGQRGREGILGEIGSGRHLARGVEGVLGVPGDLASLGASAINLGSQALTGRNVPGLETAQSYLPTSENIRNIGKKVFGNTFEPENGEDSFWERVVGDIGSYLSPVGGSTKVATAAARSLAGNVSEEAAKNLGFGKTGQATAKLVGTVASAFPGSRSYFLKKSKQAYEDAKQALTPKDKINISGLRKELDEIMNPVYTSGDKSLDYKKFVKDRAKALDKAFDYGDNVEVSEVWQFAKDFNHLWKETPSKAKPIMGKAIDAINKSLSSYGAKNPEFGRNFEAYRDIYKGLHQKDFITDFLTKNASIKNVIKKSIKNPTASSILGYLIHQVPVGSTAKAGIGAGLYGIGQLSETANLFLRSKEARKEYANILKHAAAKDVVATVNAMRRFDRAAEKFESEQQ